MMNPGESFVAAADVNKKTLISSVTVAGDPSGSPGLYTRKLGRMLAAKAGDLLPPCDFGSLLLAGYISLFAYPLFGLQSGNDWYSLVWLAALLAPFMLYERQFAALASAGNRSALLRGFASQFLKFLVVVCVIAFAVRWLDDAPQGWLALWLGSALLFTASTRVALAHGLRRLALKGSLAETVAVVGSGPVADKLIPLLQGNAVPFGLFDDRVSRSDACNHKPETTIAGLIARLSTPRAEQPDRILIALPGTAEPRLLSIVQLLRPLGIPVELFVAQNISLGRPPQFTGYVGDSLPVTLLADRPIKRWYAVLKSVKDYTLGFLIMLLLLPLLACIALAIKLDSPGPILYKQRRHGISNREFDIYKFRTMRYAPEDSGKAIRQTVRGDDRITRVGRFLRKWSLDELPQVFNVLEGNMSLVGPRPHAVTMRTEQRLGHEIVNAYPHRHRVKPGITGWAQINGSRGATDTAEQLRRRVELDLYYVENWSFLLDLKILVLTFRAVLRTTNAY